MTAILVALALASQAAPTTSGDAAEWREFASPTGGYTVAFPGVPETTVEKAASQREPVDVPTAKLSQGDVVYVIFHHDNPPFPASQQEKYLDNLRDGRKRQGTIVREKKVTIEGNPGREVWVEAVSTPTSPATLHRVRFVLVKARLYQMMVVCPKDRADATAEDADRFFASFTIQKPTTPAPGAEALAGWIDYRSPEGGFAVRVPQDPNVVKQEVETGVGRTTITLISANGQGVGYVISYRDVNATSARNAKTLFDGTRDIAVEQSKGRLLAGERRIQLGRASGREFHAEVPLGDDERGAVLRCRMYLAGRRLYQVMAVYPKDEASSEGLAEYFKTFRLIVGK